MIMGGREIILPIYLMIIQHLLGAQFFGRGSFHRWEFTFGETDIKFTQIHGT